MDKFTFFLIMMVLFAIALYIGVVGFAGKNKPQSKTKKHFKR
jgi:hypothetical protein